MPHDIPPGERRIVLVLASVAAFLTPFMGASLNVAVPVIGREFRMSAVSLGWIAMTYLLAAAVCLVPFGKIADLTGRKRIFRWGSLLHAASSLSAALAGSTAVFFGARVLQGIAGAMLISTGVAMLTSVYPPGERGRVLGLNVSFTYLGLSLGPVLGGAMTQHWGWRSIFLAASALGFILALIVIGTLKGEEWTGGEKQAVDAAGALLMAGGLISLMLGFSRLPEPEGFLLLAAAAAFLVLFILREKRAPAPILDLNLFRGNRVFAFSNLAALINYSATTAVGFVLSLHLQIVKGLSPQAAGLVLLAQPAMMVLFSPLAGRLSDRIEPRFLASSGMGIIAAGLLLLAGLNGATSTAVIAGVLLVLGFGFALFSSPNTNAVMGAVDKRSYGVASALLGTMRITGQMTSMGLATLVFALRIGRVAISAEAHPGFLAASRIIFLICAALCLAGVFASLARGKMHETAGSLTSVD
ncbi:MAG TPA: MFS transporter [Candidatus Aminicenantes bacterium]|nr:MFS transporter [Candidatus Aminicenantes bacterium]